MAFSTVACSGDTARRRAADSAVAGNAGSGSPIDASHALDLTPYLSEDTFRSLSGTCIRTDPGAGRSRILYAVLPKDSAYLRLNVVTSDGKTLEMVELVRGAPGGRIWMATSHAARGERGAVVTEAFASASDRAPVTGQLAADSREAQMLRELGLAALSLSCRAP